MDNEHPVKSLEKYLEEHGISKIDVAKSIGTSKQNLDRNFDHCDMKISRFLHICHEFKIDAIAAFTYGTKYYDLYTETRDSSNRIGELESEVEGQKRKNEDLQKSLNWVRLTFEKENPEQSAWLRLTEGTIKKQELFIARLEEANSELKKEIESLLKQSLDLEKKLDKAERQLENSEKQLEDTEALLDETQSKVNELRVKLKKAD